MQIGVNCQNLTPFYLWAKCSKHTGFFVGCCTKEKSMKFTRHFFVFNFYSLFVRQFILISKIKTSPDPSLTVFSDMILFYWCCELSACEKNGCKKSKQTHKTWLRTLAQNLAKNCSDTIITKKCQTFSEVLLVRFLMVRSYNPLLQVRGFHTWRMR